MPTDSKGNKSANNQVGLCLFGKGITEFTPFVYKEYASHPWPPTVDTAAPCAVPSALGWLKNWMLDPNVIKVGL